MAQKRTRKELIHPLLTMSFFPKINLALHTLTCQAATKILARQLVRLRQQIVNLQGSRAQIRGVATHTQVNLFSRLVLCIKSNWKF